MPGPRKGAGSRLIARQHQGHDLRAQLRVRHSIATMIVTRQDHGTEQITAISEILLALSDNAIDNFAEFLRRLDEARAARFLQVVGGSIDDLPHFTDLVAE